MKARGFTLTELLVVLGIVAVLAAIAVPITRSMVGRSREAACLGNLRAIGVGFQGYLQDHGQRLPELEAGRSSRSTDVPVLESVLLRYVDSADVFHCPADRKVFARTGSSYGWNTTQSGAHISRLRFFGIEGRPDKTPLVSDKEAWHPGGANFLYADASSSSQARFTFGK